MLINTIAKKIILIKVIFLLSILPAIPNYSQELTKSELDSLYTKFLQISAPEFLTEAQRSTNLSPEDRKCGFGLVSQVKSNLNYFSLLQQNVLKSLLQRKVKQKSMVSPSGFFRIHYDTTGSQTPIYDPTLTPEENVYQVALAADSVFRFEVNFLDFPEPPSDFGAGGDDLYDIYITSALGSYGFTEPETDLGDQRFTSFMEIHYSFSNFYTKGFNAMRVTIAHEFHHAIQIGRYIYRDEDRFFYELTSTAFEEFVYDDVNDYYNYMSNYFDNPSRKFTRFSTVYDGYDLAVWNIFMKVNYGFEIIKEQWERMPTQRAVFAISNSLVYRGASFAREYNKFAIWTYYTNYRAIPGLYFEEAANYPLIRPKFDYSFSENPFAVDDANSTSNTFVKFRITANGDTLYVIVTNGDVSASVNDPQETFNFKYTLFSDTLNGNRKLTDKYSATFYSNTSSVWSISEILNDIVLEQSCSCITYPETSCRQGDSYYPASRP